MVTLLLIIVTVLVSWKAFTRVDFYAKYTFEVEKVLVFREYYRLLTAGFVHANWLHLGLNMLTLYFFSGALEAMMGPFLFLLIYLFALAGGNLLSLFIHRFDSGYSAVGASGAVTGIIFASIAILPGLDIRFFFLPVDIPGWLFGLLFVLFAIYGIRSRRDNIGHDAHLGGGLAGLMLALLFFPQAIINNYVPILCMAVPVLLFIIILVRNPHFLLLGNFGSKRKTYYSIDQKYNAQKKGQQEEMNRILEKIHRSGIQSLTKKERGQLDEFSK